MSTYTTPIPTTRRGERIVEIESVAAGEQLNIVDILGWPASTVQIYTDDPSAQVDYRINSLIKRRTQSTLPGVGNAIKNSIAGSTEVDVWVPTTTFENTGASFQLATNIDVLSLEIVALTATGPITILVW